MNLIYSIYLLFYILERHRAKRWGNVLELGHQLNEHAQLSGVRTLSLSVDSSGFCYDVRTGKAEVRLGRYAGFLRFPVHIKFSPLFAVIVTIIKASLFRRIIFTSRIQKYWLVVIIFTISFFFSLF